MPAATTHVEFARDVFNEMDPELQKSITDKQMYFLGSQGPDFFFFSRMMMLPGSLHRYGVLMHHKNVEEAIQFIDRYSADSPALRSYFLGFLTHYALDSTTHPLVNAFAKKEHEELGTNETEAHFRQEGEIDVYILKQHGRSFKEYNVYSDLHINEEDAHLLADMYHQLFLHVYDLDIPESRIYETAWQIHWITKALFPSKLKYNLVKKAEQLTKKPKLISGMMLYDKNTDSKVLNLDHEVWSVPGYPGLTSRSSFPDLYLEAKQKALHLMKERKHEDFDRSFDGRPI